MNASITYSFSPMASMPTASSRETIAWRSGAEALESGWLDPQEVVSNPRDRTRIRELVRQVYELGLEAESTEDSEARADLYGKFLNTCNECHVLTAARIR